MVHTREGYSPDGSDMSKMKHERSSAGTEGPLGRFLVCGEPGQDIIDIALIGHSQGEDF